MIITLRTGDVHIQNDLDEAKRKSADYEWIASAELYQRTSDSVDREHAPLEYARVVELLARSQFKAAFQAESREEFTQRMELARASYERAQAAYEKANSTALSMRSRARSLLAAFWISDNPGERAGLLQESISLTEEVAQVCGSQGDKRGLAEAHKDLLTYFYEALDFSGEWRAKRELFLKALHIAENADREFEALDDSEGVELLAVAVGFLLFSMGMVEASRSLDLVKKGEGLARQLIETAEKTGGSHERSMANMAAGMIAFVKEDRLKALSYCDIATSMAEVTRDCLLLGRTHANALTVASWEFYATEDMDSRRQLFEKCLTLAPKAIQKLEIPLVMSFDGLVVTYAWLSDLYVEAGNFEVEAEKKRNCLWKAIGVAKRAEVYKNFPLHKMYIGHQLSKALYFLSVFSSPEEKASFLKEALEIREGQVKESDLLLGPRNWDRGPPYNYLALIKAELSKTIQDPKLSSALLEGAVSNMEECLTICEEAVKDPGSSFAFPAIARYYERYGDILILLYGLTKESDAARKAVKAYGEAVTWLTKAQHIVPLGPLEWKIAKLHDSLGEYRESCSVFRKSAEDYRLAVQKIPTLSSTFQELASYMDAWSLIEEARVYHEDEQFPLAAENYKKVAGILRTTRDWKHLSNQYEACSFLEVGEDLSRREQQEESIDSFSAAVRGFEESRSNLERLLNEKPTASSTQDLKDWLAISHEREKYCLARRNLEEAKVLDRKGGEEASSKKYSSAAQLFKELLAGLPVGQSQRELQILGLFCDAWAKMKEAEIKGSPELYAEAANTFSRIGDIATKKKPRIQAQANSSICKALESGTLFRRTRNTQLYSEIKKHLEAATDYYQESGLQSAADWTRATAKFFDALVYMASAATEIESKKKTELYHLAERHLGLAAKLYGKAGFTTKKNEALKHLERAREEKELLLTPSDLLSENPAVTSVGVTPVSLIRDQAIGLEKFEEANVVGNLTLSEYELSVESDLTIELELANVGKTPATLVKVENIAPQGFELDTRKTPDHSERNFIDMKGKRLEYLKTHAVKIPLKAKRKGTFELRPRVQYVDEKGNLRSYEFGPAALTVKELGISGWLKGPR